jgi:hypothetical protein
MPGVRAAEHDARGHPGAAAMPSVRVAEHQP